MFGQQEVFQKSRKGQGLHVGGVVVAETVADCLPAESLQLPGVVELLLQPFIKYGQGLSGLHHPGHVHDGRSPLTVTAKEEAQHADVPDLSCTIDWSHTCNRTQQCISTEINVS